MSQRRSNESSTLTRTIRRDDGHLIRPFASGEVKWVWEDTDESMKEFTPEASRLIESCYQNGEPHAVILGENLVVYYIYLVEMVQLNIKTNVSRKINRVDNPARVVVY